MYTTVVLGLSCTKLLCLAVRYVWRYLSRQSGLFAGELAFPKGLSSGPGRPRVPPKSPVVFDVELVYVPGMSVLPQLMQSECTFLQDCLCVGLHLIDAVA